MFHMWMSLLAASAAANPGAVRAAWSDGLAEVAVYDATLTRYNEVRRYRETQILVKERMDIRSMVKTDRPGSHPESEFDVLKSIRMLNFVTGVYDYHQSVNVFAPIDAGPGPGAVVPRPPRLAIGERPAKISVSSFEWCGTTFEEWLDRGERYAIRSFSYFDGEGDEDTAIAIPSTPWLAEEAWPIWARGLGGYGVEGRQEVQILTSALQGRYDHTPRRWVKGQLIIRPGKTSDHITLEVGTLRRWDFEVERSPWRRIQSWKGSHGTTGTLRTVERLPYWKLQSREDERARKRLGLTTQ